MSSLRGRTRLYRWNPRYPFGRELRALLRKALDQLPASERKRYFVERRRPRRAGKPQHCSDYDSHGDFGSTGAIGFERTAEREVAHLAFDASWVPASSARDDALFEDLGEHHFMVLDGPLLRGE